MVDIRSHTYMDDNPQPPQQDASSNDSKKVLTINTEQDQPTQLFKFVIVKDKCILCSQITECVSLPISKNIIDIRMCEFCYRKVLFTGIGNITPDLFDWKVVMCRCGQKRLKGDDNTRFCNCASS